jgi:hypothetical protein
LAADIGALVANEFVVHEIAHRLYERAAAEGRWLPEPAEPLCKVRPLRDARFV